MTEVRASSGRSKYLPYLEGIRGYGFLLVFLVHYCPPYQIARAGSLAFRLCTGLEPITFLAVPVFFTLSGYLIGGILHGTRDREGYFSVFYSRRLLRVFPLYYLALLVIACVEVFLRFPLNYHFWVHFLYIQNLFPDYVTQHSPAVLLHYWSLATEEQFYLLWPLVVWFFPGRRTLFGVAALFIIIIFGIRFAAPYFLSSPEQIHYLSLTRADAILLGVLLALIRHKPIFERIKPIAKWIALVGIVTMVAWALRKGESWPETFRGVQVLIPWINFTALAIIVAVMEENSWLNRVCSQQWICWLGRRSYSLYIVHFTYARLFWDHVTPYLATRLPQTLAAVVSSAIAFSLTLVLAMLSYRFIETPTQNLKRRLKYGEVRSVSLSRSLGGEVLVKTGT
ncbi:MAG: acyltransferase family protein [Terracidiphilus sp.]